jgi:hypothetical protein
MERGQKGRIWLHLTVRADDCDPPYIRKGSLPKNPPNPSCIAPSSPPPHTHTHTTNFRPHRQSHVFPFTSFNPSHSITLKLKLRQLIELPTVMMGTHQRWARWSPQARRPGINQRLTAVKAIIIKHDLWRGKEITYPRLDLVLIIWGLAPAKRAKTLASWLEVSFC